MKNTFLYILKYLSLILIFIKKLITNGFHCENNGILFIKLKLSGSVKIVLKSGYIVKTKFTIKGINNSLIFDEDVKIINCEFIISGDNCIIDFRGSRIMNNSKFELLDSDTKLIVKNNTGFNNNRILVAGIGNRIEIGSECIFAENAEVWASDTHSILDVKTNLRINADKPIFIDDYVWVGNRALIFKGVSIGKNAIVAAGSIVTKDVANNTLVAGIPANVLKENIKWDINRL
jgi:acetyltransferase-like isoleucine patch superfamily enzyme